MSEWCHELVAAGRLLHGLNDVALADAVNQTGLCPIGLGFGARLVLV